MQATIEDYKNGYADVYIQGFADYDIKACDFIEIIIARHIVACVNACEGIDTELLETAFGEGMVKSNLKIYTDFQRLRQQNAELAEALKIARSIIVDEFGFEANDELGGASDAHLRPPYAKIVAALAKHSAPDQ